MGMVYETDRLKYEDYAQLRASVGWCNWPREQAEAALARSLCTVTAVEDGRSVGMGRLVGDGLYCMAVDVVVRPEAQGRGTGSAIMARLLEHARRAASPGGRVSVQLIAEPGKEGFYERLGFRHLPHESCGAGMRKVLHGSAPEK